MTDENPQSPTPAPGAPNQDGAAAAPRSPGAMIRDARERAHISLEDLATQMKLARHTLDALERDDFKHLLEPVYIRGYYRKCAKLLALDDKDLINAYEDRATPKQPAAPSKLRLASGSELGSGTRLPIPMAIAGTVVGIFFCVFVWNMFKAPQQTPALIAEPQTPSAISAAPTGAPALPLDQAMPPFTAPAAKPAASGGDEVSVPQRPDASAPVSTTPAPTAPAITPTPRPASVATGSVSLSFSNTSWVRVDDSSGKILLNGLMHAGDKQTLQGKLPFTVFLGNAPVVGVMFEKRPLDITPLIADNLTARFTLPMPAKP